MAVAGGAAAVVALALVFGTVGSTWQAVRATKAEADARRQRITAEANERRAIEKEQAAEQERIKAEAARDEVRRTLYASDLNLAQIAWEHNNGARVLELLARHRPESGQADLRGFEWYYLRRQAQSELRTVAPTGEMLSKFTLSPDGLRLALNASRELSGDFTLRN